MSLMPAGPGIGPFLARVHARRIMTCLCVVAFATGFTHGQAKPNATAGSGSPDARDAAAVAWLNDLYTPGVTYIGDSIHFNDETRRITTDSLYRSAIYPPTYSWAITSALMQKKAIKPAVWHLINLYHADTANHKMVMQMILPMDQILEMDRVLIAAYYTYIPFDPEVFTIVNGRTERVKRPDIAEKKLIATKAIAELVYADRKTRGK